MVIYFVLFGLIGGALGGMGMGGGTLLIPLLTFFLAVNQLQAQAVNLLVFLPMAAVALFIHWRNRMLETKGVLWIVVPGIFSTILFSYLASLVDTSILRRVFGGFLILIALYECWQFFIATRDEKLKNKVKAKKREERKV